MKILLFIMFYSVQVFAKDCSLFQLKGTVEDKSGFRITIHEGTNSEKFFVFPQKFDLKMAPYHKKYIQGRFIMMSREPVSGSEIIGIQETEFAVPDPLHHHNEILFKKNIPCLEVSEGKP
jgi:hypothetical protein